MFSELLEVSVDDILSGGEYCRPVSTRLSNYSIAFSENVEEWEAYIQRPDKLILNTDEYGKTVIDYALEFHNYPFLKYLMDKKYIWFDSGEQNEYWNSFGAGTSIERRTPERMDLLNVKMKERDELRTNLIALAAENEDFEMLDQLRAREIPALYEASYKGYRKLDFEKYINPQMIESLSKCSEKVLVYYSQEFTVTSNILKQGCIFCFPYLGELIDLAIEKKSKAATEMLGNSLKHNKKVFKRILQVEKTAIASISEYSQYLTSEEIKDEIMKEFRFYEENDVVHFNSGYISKDDYQGICSNVIRISVSSKNRSMQSLIDEVNEVYDKIANYEYGEEE